MWIKRVHAAENLRTKWKNGRAAAAWSIDGVAVVLYASQLVVGPSCKPVEERWRG